MQAGHESCAGHAIGGGGDGEVPCEGGGGSVGEVGGGGGAEQQRRKSGLGCVMGA